MVARENSQGIISSQHIAFVREIETQKVTNADTNAVWMKHSMLFLKWKGHLLVAYLYVLPFTSMFRVQNRLGTFGKWGSGYKNPYWLSYIQLMAMWMEASLHFTFPLSARVVCNLFQASATESKTCQLFFIDLKPS